MSTSIFAFSGRKKIIFALGKEENHLCQIFGEPKRTLMERIRGQDSVQECVVALNFNFNGVI